jgi:hypothetical protein
MKHNLAVTLTIGTFALFSTATSFAQSEYDPQYKCQPIEFAELQTYSEAELRTALFTNEKNLKGATEWEEMKRRHGDQMSNFNPRNGAVLTKDADKYKEDMTICKQQVDRLNRLLSRKKPEGS